MHRIPHRYKQRPPRHSARRNPQSVFPPANASGETKFDPESGLVFSEVEVRPQRIKHTNWIYDLSTPNVVVKATASTSGTRSLFDIARTKVIKEFQNLTSDHFASIPFAVAEEIWQQVVATHSESFYIWRTLATAYPQAEEFGQRQYRHLLRIKQPTVPSIEYFKGITSSSLTWLTCLRLSPKRMSMQDVVAIHMITNIVVLDLSDSGNEYGDIRSPFDERLMMSWASLAGQGKAFQHLRVLLCGWQENLSKWIFNYTHRFPSLCHVIVTDCPKMHQKNRPEWEDESRAAGWEARHAKRSAKSLRPIIQSDDFLFGSVSASYYESKEIFAQLEYSRRSNVPANLPVLEFWLGTPRQWSHIVDDFPGHRTIFFDRVGLKTQDIAGTTRNEQTKRARNQEQTTPGTASPPAKRGQQNRPMMRSTGRNLTEMLKGFEQ